ncbi:MAG: hypothetical protein PHW46_06355 [Candidatus Omnitrophica bacterium]|nr:hypothetical protein [Candidatus Omnitrophota bacterium]
MIRRDSREDGVKYLAGFLQDSITGNSKPNRRKYMLAELREIVKDMANKFDELRGYL